MKSIELRLVRLERDGRAGWEAYQGKPLEEWPDAALWAFLGLPADAAEVDLLRLLTPLVLP